MRPASATVLILVLGCTPDAAKETATPAQDTADTAAPTDADGDGFTAEEDCDDDDASINPSASEVCDGVDNDCDTLIDDADSSVDASGSGLFWYPDEDGDGYGDEDAPQAVCALADGMLTDGSDCDDTDATVNPDAYDYCDGIDNDCRSDTAEGGTAAWEDDAGAWSDWTADLQPAGADPLPVTLDAPGTLYLCEGDWPLLLSVTTNADIVGPAGAEKTRVDGRGAGRPLSITTTGGVTVTGLTLTGGLGQGDLFGFTLGGGLYCEGEIALSLEGVDISENSAGIGAGLHSEGCELGITDSTIQRNTGAYAGGGLALFNANANVARTTIRDNLLTEETSYGGGIMVRSTEDGRLATMMLADSIVERNTATYGGGLYIPNGEVSCSGSGGPRNGGFYSHSGETAAVYLEGGSFSSNNCDFGPPGSKEDNTPSDVATDFNSYSFDDDWTFSCTEEAGCQ